jgi:hypothetical protein
MARSDQPVEQHEQMVERRGGGVKSLDMLDVDHAIKSISNPMQFASVSARRRHRNLVENCSA